MLGTPAGADPVLWGLRFPEGTLTERRTDSPFQHTTGKSILSVACRSTSAGTARGSFNSSPAAPIVGRRFSTPSVFGLHGRETPGETELHAQQPGQARPGEFPWGLAVIKLEVLLLAGCVNPAHGPIAMSRPLVQVPSGNRRPQTAGSAPARPEINTHLGHYPDIVSLDTRLQSW